MNRRDFLSGVAALPALGAWREVGTSHTPKREPARTGLHPTAQRTGAGDRGLKVGTVTYNIAKDWDIPTIIKNLTEVGMDAVELRTTHKHGVEIPLSPAARAEVRKRFDDSPVKIGGLGTICEYHAADPAVVRKNIEETKAWVALARDVGAPGVKVRPNGMPKNVPEEKTLEQIGKALAECGAAAQDHGVKIQLEVHGAETSRLPRIRKILDYGGNHPGVRVCWNSNPADLLDGGFEANFKLVRDQIGQVHMRDLFVEDYPSRQLIASLAAMKFDGYCFAEIPESADPVRVLKYFRGLFRAYQNL
jgi:sugar phosphate isomerase/epimerase